jgi:hypothetical protein
MLSFVNQGYKNGLVLQEKSRRNYRRWLINSNHVIYFDTIFYEVTEIVY